MNALSAPAWGSPAAIYAIDKACAELCTAMSTIGVGFDADRAREMLTVLEAEEASASDRLAHAIGRKINALSVKELQKAFFSRPAQGGLGAPVFFRSQLTGNPSLGVDALRGYAACADDRLRAAALAVIDVRRARKIRSTYVLRPLAGLGRDGRIHPTWKNAGPVSGRWACQDPNLMNLPRAETEPHSVRALGGIRGLYRAREGFVIVSFDKSQLEMRVAAYASADAAMISACESSDLHGGNARVIFGGAFDFDAYVALKARHKSAELDPESKAIFDTLEDLRTLAKSAGFAVCYMAKAETVYARIVASGKGHLLRKGLASVEAMLAKLRRGFATYFSWQERRLLDAIREGYTDEPVTGRRRWLGHDPSPTECANHPIQAGAAGVMNTELPRIVRRLAADVPRAALLAQVHDAGYFEIPANDHDIDRTKSIIKEEGAVPVFMHSSGLSACFPSDLKVSERMAV